MATSIVITEEQLEGLRMGFGGTLLRADDEGDEDARRVHNGLIDRRPSADRTVPRRGGRRRRRRSRPRGRARRQLRGGGHNVAGRAVVDDA